MPKILRAVKANPGIRAAYRRRLEKLIDEMNASVLWWIRAAYREREDEIVPEPVAADAAQCAHMSRPADKKGTDDPRCAFRCSRMPVIPGQEMRDRTKKDRHLLPRLPGKAGSCAVISVLKETYPDPEKVSIKSCMAADASPARFLQRTLARLFRYWTNRWDDEAQKIAESFVNSASRKTRASYLQAFRDSGFTVKADPSRILNNTVQALIGENVALIKTIPQQLFGDLTQMVQRSIAEGRDVPALEAEIMDRCGKTKKRAAVIARDQTNKAAEAVKRAENQRLGITEGIWVHVPGRKYARKSHMEFNGKKFKLDEGLYDRNEGKKVRPGECINCCCTYRPIVPGFGE